MGTSRLDSRLVDDCVAPTRSRARDYILRGLVTVDGTVCNKPSRMIRPESVVRMAEGAPQFVSRGAEKLVAALDHFALLPQDRTALDIGASTGGFTEVLLQRGARRVYAVDVGHGQLHPTIKNDQRVVSLEGVDARSLDSTLIAEPIDLVVADVSFISLTKALGVALTMASPGSFAVALIKPQFEVGRDWISKGGIVRDEVARDAAVERVAVWVAEQPGWQCLGVLPSPIKGGSGNAEFLVGALKDG